MNKNTYPGSAVDEKKKSAVTQYAQGAANQAQTQQDNTAPSVPAWQSDTVLHAQQTLDDYIKQKPGAYQSKWQEQQNAVLDKLLNREPFRFDVNEDALYQQLLDQYVAQGRQAMMDTMGQAAALTGGYGNSYAQSAGQQAYQGYLQEFNGMMPQFYQMALDRYQMEGDQLADQFAMLGAREDQDYGRYQDEMDAYNAELERLLGSYYTERDFAYDQSRDQAADEKWQKEFDEDKRRYDQEWELAVGDYTGQNGGGSGSSGGSGGYSGGGPGGDSAENPEEVTDENAEVTLSENGQNFLDNLPYLHAGGDVEGWKRTVAGQLYRGLENGTLSEADVAIIMMRLGLEDILPDDKDFTGTKPPEGNKNKNNGGGGGLRHEMIAWG